MTTTIRTPETIIDGPFGVELIVKSEDTDGRFGLVEHPIAPRALAGPMHVHEREDEYSYVLEGEVGFQVGDEVFTAEPGQLVAKPRGIWHGFWNPGDQPARVLELISPGGFENYFSELAPLLQPERDFEGMARVQEKYGLEMDFSSIERLSREHGLGRP
ncbi:MAG TPA: cupin domain-containing protein [Thermoleophilaceae bacterium]